MNALKVAVFLIGVALVACALPGGNTFHATFEAREGDLRIDRLPVSFDDRTGLVTAIATVEGPWTDFDTGIRAVPDSPSQLSVRWLGGACDGNVRATFRQASDRYALHLESSLRPLTFGCVAVGILRELKVTFATPIEASAVELTQAGG